MLSFPRSAKSFLLLGLVLAAAYSGWKDWSERPIPRAPGVLVPDEPAQNLLPPATPPFRHKGEWLQPLANYRIKARLILKESYRFDPGARISPLDLCVGWGELSDSAVLDGLRFSQSARFCRYGFDSKVAVDESLIARKVANIHAIPSDDFIHDQLSRLRPGQVVVLSGQLVRADGKDGGEWKSSLSREDTGPGACELMYIRSVRVE